MAFVSGTAGSVAYVSGGTTTIISAHEWSIDISQDTPEVTAFGDGWKNFIQGIKEWKASVGVRVDGAQASQDFVRNLIIGGSAPLPFRFAMGTNIYSGSALVTGAAPELAYDGAGEIKYDLQGCGPLSYA